jgi:hypothetical protein
LQVSEKREGENPLPSSIVLLTTTRESFLSPVAKHLEEIGVATIVIPAKRLKAINRKAYSLRREPALGRRSFDDWRLIGPELLQTLDRTLLKPLSGKELIGYFNWLVLLSNELLDGIPEGATLIFEHSPHHSWSITFAHVAESRGHKTLSLEDTLVSRRITIRRALRPERPEYVRAAQDINLTNGLLRSSVLVSANHRRDQSLHRKSRSRYETLKHFCGWFGELLFLVASSAVPKSRQKKFLRGRWPVDDPLVVAAAKVQAAKKAASNNRFLTRFGSQDAHREQYGKYAYMALPRQPERTTEPDCGQYADPLLFLVDVRNALDESGHPDMPILVREHPWQNRQPVDHITLPFRGKGFYEFIRGIPNVRLVHPNVSPDELMEGARLVVTANGSSAWEGLTRGKPALTARKRWYADCGAVTHLIDEPDIKSKLAVILGLSSEEILAGVERFLIEERVSLPVHIGEPLSEVETTAWASAMADALVERTSLSL